MKNTLNLRSSKETHHSDMLVYAHVPQLYVQIIRSSKTLMSMENGCVCMTIRLQFYDTLMQKKNISPILTEHITTLVCINCVRIILCHINFLYLINKTNAREN